MATKMDEQTLKRGVSNPSVNSKSPVEEVGPEELLKDAPVSSVDPVAIRPEISFASFGAFASSFGKRFKSIWTRRLILSILAGQLLSLCITSTSIITTELVNRGFALPTTQSFFLYFFLFIIYTPYTIFQYGFKGWAKMVFKDGWKYFILAAADVEANFLVVKAYQNTNLLSAMLLDSWAIPMVMLFTYIYLRTRFHWTQYLGVFVCCVGMALLVVADKFSNNTDPGKSKLKGDLFMIAGATLYGFTNATEEYFVRFAPLYQVVGQLGMWGMIINGIQAAALEHEGMRTAAWSGEVIGFIAVFCFSMFILYTVAPILYRMASSTFFNLSILSSDFYGLLFGLFLYKLKVWWLYFPAFVIVITGLVVYFWHTAPEEGILDIKAPEYVTTRKERKAKVLVPDLEVQENHQ